MKQFLSKIPTSMRSGFTLVEMLVVLGLFSYIMTLATGVLYLTQEINVKLQAIQSVLDNVNLSTETMTRDIRYGTDFHCAQSIDEPAVLNEPMPLRKSCSYQDGGGKVLFFKPADAVNDGDRVAYYTSPSLSGGTVIYKDEYTCIDPVTFCSTGWSTTTYQITSNDVKIKSFIFYVEGANTVSGVGTDVGDVHDNIQPLVTVNISGETIPINATATPPTRFDIETSVSPRGIDK